jgi:hypothetical protein
MSSVNKKANFSFAAINPYAESNIISPKEKQYTGKDYVEWGDGNLYPEFLQALYDNVPTLQSIIEGCVDYVAGDAVSIFLNRSNMFDIRVPCVPCGVFRVARLCWGNQDSSLPKRR